VKFLLPFPARCLLAVLLGLIYAAAFPPLGWRFAGVIPGIAGLIFILRGLQGTRARAIGFLFGLAAFGWSLSWLFQVFGAVAIMLYCVLAAFPALFAEMQSRAETRGLKGWALTVFTTLNWCGWEFIRAELFPLRFPWMTAGLAAGPNSLLPLVGVYGVSLLVVFIAAVFATRKLRFAIPVLLLLMLLLFYQDSRWNDPGKLSADGPDTIKVGGLQMETVTLTEFLNGTRELPQDVSYVVWPEYAIPYDIRQNKRDWDLVQNLCRDRNITLTLGTQSRPMQEGGWRNIALTLDPDGVRGEHNKVHTVHMFDDGIAGTTALPVATRHGEVGTPVCFDCDYEGVVRKMTAAGAEVFIVPIMDAISWTPRQHEQHAELFRIRASENGRWMFVCSTSGVSQIISPKGKVTARRGPSDQGALVGIVARETKLTFYTRAGWLFPWFVLGLATLAWIWLMWPRRISRKAV